LDFIRFLPISGFSPTYVAFRGFDAGTLFAVTLKKAEKSKVSGALIAVGHGIAEFPLMFLIFFVLKPI